MNRKAARTCLITTTVVFAIAGAVAILPAMTSVFLFDAPGSDKNPATILLFWSALTAPLVCAASIVGSWIVYALKRFKAACWIAFTPLINIAGGAAALIWLELFNGGRLS